MKQINVNGKEVLMCEKPDVEIRAYLLQTMPDANLAWLCFLDDKEKEVAKSIQFTGQWHLLGLASEIKEEQWAEILERNDIEMFRDWDIPPDEIGSCTKSATASGLSLLKAHGYKAETTLILVKK